MADDRRGVVGAHQVALVHLQQAGAAADRRGDGRVVELHLGALDIGAIGGDRPSSAAACVVI
jgi:hypothetical protein